MVFYDFLTDGQSQAAPLDFGRIVGGKNLLQHFGGDAVITSYSIHYTKLYDTVRDKSVEP